MYQAGVCQAGVCVGGECNTPPSRTHVHTHTHTHTHTHFSLKFVGIMKKCACKISWSNFDGKFGVFYRKKRNVEFYQYPVIQISNFCGWWRLLKKLYKICTDYYDNDEYLAVKCIRFLPARSYVCNLMFIKE